LKTTARYAGSRDPDVAGPADVVRIDPDGGRVAIDWRLDLFNHSPSGLNWGYGGSGPAQCALAILADYFGGDDQLALLLHQDFKAHFVAGFDDVWELDGSDIRDWLAAAGIQPEDEKLQPRRVTNVVEEDGGFRATLEPCGHEVWFAVAPPKELVCAECINELVDAIRKERV